MTKTHKLRFELGEPEHGWMRWSLAFQDQQYQVFASDVAHDSVSGLVNALLDLEFQTRAVVELYLEPDLHELVLVRDGPTVKVTVEDVAQMRPSMFTANVPDASACHVFWKGLRDLQTRLPAQEYAKCWGHEFPEREMQLLTERVQELSKSRTFDPAS